MIPRSDDYEALRLRIIEARAQINRALGMIVDHDGREHYEVAPSEMRTTLVAAHEALAGVK